jgi:hypothetical protein
MSDSSVLGKRLEIYLRESSGLHKDKIEGFEEIHNEFRLLLSENEKLKRQKEEFKYHLGKSFHSKHR